MAFILLFAAEVQEDLQQGIDWYNEQQKGLGSRFFTSVKEQITRISKSPASIAIRYDEVRCVKIRDFPYLIHFMIFPDTNTVKIIAVFSTHRDPQMWKSRL
ncbi:MAG: type II toxin-antitoxin system RelE/ParE family toxin [Bacteroidales bacterium]|nr:type II toxin-antitoxin system RelE/ParE family toxin [Bacteroidales bacterium]